MSDTIVVGIDTQSSAKSKSKIILIFLICSNVLYLQSIGYMCLAYGIAIFHIKHSSMIGDLRGLP